jgi:hypothetical protein
MPVVRYLLVLILASSALAETVTVRIDPASTYDISPFIYGANQADWKWMTGRITATRWGGNRTTAYNWENNASNAGIDWKHQNDWYFSRSDEPGEAVGKWLTAAQKARSLAIVTVPCIGYVSADKGNDGDVAQTPDFLSRRFHRSLPSKGRAFAFPPDPADKFVYQDEFAWWIGKTFAEQPVLFALCNEPDLWASTHARLHPQPVTFAELAKVNIDYATAIKKAVPNAQVVGMCSFGWSGYHHLQQAPDRNGRDFFDFYCQQMAAAEKAAGRRLIDVIDIHYYSEARGGGVRVIEDQAGDALYAARLQAPRSLWDPTYQEDSWITRDNLKEPMQELRRLRRSIDKHYPGTKLAVGEYDFGGKNHISGTIAQADALGIFGREGVYIACNWRDMTEGDYIWAGFRAFRDYDGRGGAFGRTGLAVQSTADPAAASIYASRDEGGRVVAVAINKTAEKMPVKIALTTGALPRSATVYSFTASELRPRAVRRTVDRDFTTDLPAMSVSTIVFSK